MIQTSVRVNPKERISKMTYIAFAQHNPVMQFSLKKGRLRGLFVNIV